MRRAITYDLPRSHRCLPGIPWHRAAVEKVGGSLSNPLQMSVLGEKAEITIKELTVRRRYEPTPDEVRAIEKYELEKQKYSWASKPMVRKWEYRFTGSLEFLVSDCEGARDADVMRLKIASPNYSFRFAVLRWASV